MNKTLSTSRAVTDTLLSRVSVRDYKPDTLPAGMLDAILDAARRSPTSSNMQTYSIVVVEDEETKRKLAELAGNQKHIVQCPVFLAFCADIHRLELACEMHGVELAKGLETTLVSTVDAALVGMSAQTAAESFGLGSVMIGGMRNHPRDVAEVLGLPDGVYVVYGMCLGWAESTPSQKPRLPAELIVHRERYQQQDERALLAEHDRELAEHYGRQGRNLDEAAWSGPIAKRLHTQSRPKLRKTLEAMGFRFD